MSCTKQTTHDGHWEDVMVWNAEKGKYEEKKEWCPGK